MPEGFQLRLIWLLTMRCEGPPELLSRDEMCFGLSCDETYLERIHETFLSKNFNGEDWSIINWNKRQYVSDLSTDLFRKFRANKDKKLYETLQKQDETQN